MESSSGMASARMPAGYGRGAAGTGFGAQPAEADSESGMAYIPPGKQDDLKRFYSMPIAGNVVSSPETEREVEQLHVKHNRPLLQFFITQRRYDFGKPIELHDRVVASDKIAEYRRHPTTTYELARMEHDMGFQAAAATKSVETQTAFERMVNKATQYAPVELSNAERRAMVNSAEMQRFLARASTSLMEALKYNEAVDVLKDEFAEFEAAEQGLFGPRTENGLREAHTFQGLRYLNGRAVGDVCWHPTSAGVCAFSCANSLTFEQGVDASGRALTSHILVWDFAADMLHPHLVLEVPGDVTRFSFHPTHSHILVAGMASGQVCIWDLSEQRKDGEGKDGSSSTSTSSGTAAGGAASGRVSSAGPGKSGAGAGAAASSRAAAAAASAARGGGAGGAGAAKGGRYKSDGDLDEGGDSSKTLFPYCVSQAERSHSRPVTELIILPERQDMSRRGEASAVPSHYPSTLHFATLAGDGRLLFWNVYHSRPTATSFVVGAEPRPMSSAAGGSTSLNAAAQSATSSSGSAAAAGGAGAEAAGGAAGAPKMQHDDVKWAPFYTLPLTKPDGVPMLATKLALGPNFTCLVGSEDGEIMNVTYATRPAEFANSKEGRELAGKIAAQMQIAVGLEPLAPLRSDQDDDGSGSGGSGSDAGRTGRGAGVSPNASAGAGPSLASASGLLATVSNLGPPSSSSSSSSSSSAGSGSGAGAGAAGVDGSSRVLAQSVLAHSTAVTGVQRSPHFSDIYITVRLVVYCSRLSFTHSVFEHIAAFSFVQYQLSQL